MVKLVTVFKKKSSLGGLSGKTRVTTFRTVEEAQRHKKWLQGEYVSSEIIARKRTQPRQRNIFDGLL